MAILKAYNTTSENSSTHTFGRNKYRYLNTIKRALDERECLMEGLIRGASLNSRAKSTRSKMSCSATESWGQRLQQLSGEAEEEAVVAEHQTVDHPHHHYLGDTGCDYHNNCGVSEESKHLSNLHVCIEQRTDICGCVNRSCVKCINACSAVITNS
ncbi:hypothetical protein EMCRGX_G017320 [Ephydatia muelleri]